MADTTLPAQGDFSQGNVFNRAWGVLRANFSFFVFVGLLIALVQIVASWVPDWVADWSADSPQLFDTAFWPLVLGAWSGWASLAMIGQAVILFGAFQHLRGEPIQTGEAYRRALARFFPIVGVTLLYAAGVLSGPFLAAMITSAARALGPIGGATIIYGGGAIAFILGIVSIFVLMARWAVAVPVCVVEGLSPIKSLGRSASLTKGERGAIFGGLFAMMLVNSIVVGFVTKVLAPNGSFAALGFSLIWMSCWYAYWHCFTVMMYHDLRVAKEGIDTGQIAAVSN